MTEDQIQQQIVVYYRNLFKGLIFSCPNGGSRNIVEAKKLKATGLLAGVSDLIILKPNGKTIFVEVKTEIGKQSDAQSEFQKKVQDMGFDYYLVRSLQEFKNYDL